MNKLKRSTESVFCMISQISHQFLFLLLLILHKDSYFIFQKSLFETIQTLFWAVFGLVDLESFELDGIKIFTRFWGMLMFGTYSVINIVVLLNLLIAMMNHSYQLISVLWTISLLHLPEDILLWNSNTNFKLNINWN